MYGGRSGYGRGAHDPEVCFPAQGWEILRSSSVVVPQREDRIHTKLLRAERLNREQAVLYWFQPARRWPKAGAFEEALRVLDAASGRPQYAFVRLSSPRDGSGRSEADLMEFASALAPAIRAEVESF
jgi:EpsI family protein